MKAVDILIAMVGKDLREHQIALGSQYMILRKRGYRVSVVKGNLEPILYYNSPCLTSFEFEPDVIVMIQNQPNYLWKIEY